METPGPIEGTAVESGTPSARSGTGKALVAGVAVVLLVSSLAATAEEETAPISARLRWLDWAVIALQSILMLVIGMYCARRSRTADDYLPGGRLMKSLAVELSLFAAMLSAIPYLALPGEMIKRGPVVLSFVGGLIAFVATRSIRNWSVASCRRAG